MSVSILDYLEPSVGDLRSQLQGIVSRNFALPGKRQVDFVPAETLLCFTAAFRINHRSFGGATSHLAPTPVPELAKLFRRPPSSVLAKMANLDGSRTNGAKHEINAAAVLVADPERSKVLYLQILESTRSLGIDRDALPDFLGLETEFDSVDSFVDRIPDREVEESIQPMVEKWAHDRPDVDVHITERLLFGSARIGQQRFARAVMSNCESKCVFCGFGGVPAAIKLPGMLVASHVKPWRKSSNAERMDYRNGLAACPTHDAAFDSFLITIGLDSSVCLSPLLATAISIDPVLAHNFGAGGMARKLFLSDTAASAGAKYFEWHFREVMGFGYDGNETKEN